MNCAHFILFSHEHIFEKKNSTFRLQGISKKKEE